MLFTGSGATGSIVRGVGFAQYGSIPDPSKAAGAVQLDCDGVTLDSCTFQHNSSDGLYISKGSGHAIRHCLYLDNGFRGISATHADNLIHEDNRAWRNNARLFTVVGEPGAAAAGKFTYSPNMRMRRDVWGGTLAAHGVWFDLGCTNSSITGSKAIGNDLSGFEFEITAGVLLADFVAVGNANAVKAANTAGLEISNGVMLGNARNIFLTGDDRGVTDPSVRTGNIRISNVVHGDSTNGDPIIEARDYATGSATHPASAFFAAINGNAYYRASAGPLLTLWGARYGSAGDQNPTNYSTLAALQGLGYEAQGQVTFGGSNPYLRDPANGDYRTAVAYQQSGVALSSRAATELGVAASPVPIGLVTA